MDDGERTLLEEEIAELYAFLLTFSEPLPKDIAKAIDEEFWNLIAEDIPDLAETD